MRKILLVAFTTLFIAGCTTQTDDINLIEGDKNTLTITVEYSEKIMSQNITSSDEGSWVYLFEKFEARTLVNGSFTNNYDYLGNGVFEHKETKERVSYTKKITADIHGKAKFTGVPQATHTIAADSKKTGKTEWITINTKSSNTHKFSFAK